MRKYIKAFFISLASLFLLVVIVISITVWIVFTPERLTPIVRNQAEKYIPYKTEIGEVELTLFSTFPQFGIKVSGFAVISPLSGSSCDTLLRVSELTGIIDAKAYWQNNEVIISKFILSSGSANVFSDSLGLSNYALLISEADTEPEVQSDEGNKLNFDLQNIEINNLNLTYADLAAKSGAAVFNLSATLSGSVIDGKIKGNLVVDNAGVSFEYEGEKYLDNVNLKFSIPADIDPVRQSIIFKEAWFSVNDMGILINGLIENDTIDQNIVTDIEYQLDSWQIKDVINLVPPSYISETGKFEASGIITSGGTIKGLLSDSMMPVMNINLTLTDGNLDYHELPFPLREIGADMHLYSDYSNSAVSYLDVNHFEAKTPESALSTKGKISNIYSDMHMSLVTGVDVLMDEIRTFIPDSLNLAVNGRAGGLIETDFTMSQLEGFLLDQMRLAGSASFSGFSLTYDSISVSTDNAKVDFSLPNPVVSGRDTNFAFIKLASGNLSASKKQDFSTFLENAHIYIEMSDLRDTTIIPDLFCTFSADTIWGRMDTLQIAIDKPMGNISLSPLQDKPDHPVIKLAYTSYDLYAEIGANSLMLEDIIFNTDIINDKAQEDIFLQWLARGFVDMSNGHILLSALNHPVEVPAIKMNFDPESLKIQESRIIIDKSDFELTGTADNVLSYFRGDSILRGDFSFHSGNTDLAQLLSLTSGIGAESGTGVEDEMPHLQDEQPAVDSITSGPYMVPMGMDVLLKADVSQATLYADTVINIIGDIRVNDGILLLDGLTFTTPAADMQLTAMYRTPRKNHIFLGIDYHMMDVEISRLLKMLPDIDTLMPMLRSFGGSGEFHLAVETYLDSLYNIKKSTLRGASSIKGEDLVLMDGETFGEIAKTLKFSRKAENRVDSLSAEFTIFREEVDVYPFLLVMDRYKVVVGGRHNFDMSFDYHISTLESPLPVRLGINVGGTIDELKYGLASPRYAELYRPVTRNVVKSRQLEFRKMIREALLEKVRD